MSKKNKEEEQVLSEKEKKSEKRVQIIGVIFLIIMLGLSVILLIKPGKELKNPDDMKVKTFYQVKIFLEDDVVLATKLELGDQAESSSRAIPCSITINNEKYYSYVFVFSGVYSNYVSNNQYSWNKSNKTIKLLTIDKKDAKEMLDAWCEERNIDKKYILKYGFEC